MKVRKGWIGSKKAATKGDLADLQEDIHVDLAQMEQRQSEKFATKADLQETEARLKAGLISKETGEEILAYLKSFDQQRKEQRGLPEEVDKLKSRVFKLELKR